MQLRAAAARRSREEGVISHVVFDHAGLEHPLGTAHTLRGVGRLGALVRFWRAYARAFNELSSLDDYELHDIGISRCNIPWIARQTALASALATPRQETWTRRTAAS